MYSIQCALRNIYNLTNYRQRKAHGDFSFVWGLFQLVNKGSKKCLDNHSYLFQAPDSLFTDPCHYHLDTQVCELHTHPHTHVRTHARSHTHARTHARTYARTHTHTHTRAHERTATHTSTGTQYRHWRTRTHERTHERTHTHTHTYTHTVSC